MLFPSDSGAEAAPRRKSGSGSFSVSQSSCRFSRNDPSFAGSAAYSGGETEDMFP